MIDLTGIEKALAELKSESLRVSFDAEIAVGCFWKECGPALITELRAARRVVEAARKFHGNINESVFTQNCTVCQEIAAYDTATHPAGAGTGGGKEGKPVIVLPLDALYDAQLKAEAALAKLEAPADGKCQHDRDPEPCRTVDGVELHRCTICLEELTADGKETTS